MEGRRDGARCLGESGTGPSTWGLPLLSRFLRLTAPVRTPDLTTRPVGEVGQDKQSPTFDPGSTRVTQTYPLSWFRGSSLLSPTPGVSSPPAKAVLYLRTASGRPFDLGKRSRGC